MKNQSFYPKASDMRSDNTVVVRTLGLDHPEGRFYRRGREWQRHQVLRHDKFLLSVLEGYNTASLVIYRKIVV
jgi:hypothetical protein